MHRVLVKNGVVYRTVNPKTGSLRKGLYFDDQVDYSLRKRRYSSAAMICSCLEDGTRFDDPDFPT